MAKNMTQIQTFRQTMETNWQYCNRIHNDNISCGCLWIPHYSPIAACGKSVSCALTICMARTMDWTSRNQWRDAFFTIKSSNIPEISLINAELRTHLAKTSQSTTLKGRASSPNIETCQLDKWQGITLKKHSSHAKCTFNMPQSSSKRFLRHYPFSFWSLFWTGKKHVIQWVMCCCRNNHFPLI